MKRARSPSRERRGSGNDNAQRQRLSNDISITYRQQSSRDNGQRQLAPAKQWYNSGTRPVHGMYLQTTAYPDYALQMMHQAMSMSNHSWHPHSQMSMPSTWPDGHASYPHGQMSMPNHSWPFGCHPHSQMSMLPPLPPPPQSRPPLQTSAATKPGAKDTGSSDSSDTPSSSEADSGDEETQKRPQAEPSPASRSAASTYSSSDNEDVDENDESALKMCIHCVRSTDLDANKDVVKDQLNKASKNANALFVVTLDRDYICREQNQIVSQQTFKTLLDVDGIKRFTGSKILSDEKGGNVAVYWDPNSCKCDAFVHVTTSDGPQAIRFKLQTEEPQEQISCAVIQVEDNKKASATVQNVWKQLEPPCFAIGNLLMSGAYAHECILAKTRDDEGAKKQMLQSRGVWPAPAILSALPRGHIKEVQQVSPATTTCQRSTSATQRPLPCTLSIALRRGKPRPQDPASIPEKQEDDDVLHADTASDQYKSSCVQNFVALVSRTMRTGLHDIVTEDQLREIRDAAESEIDKVVQADTDQRFQKLQFLSHLTKHLLCDQHGQPQDSECFEWWEYCHHARKKLSRKTLKGYSRKYQAPIEDLRIRCSVDLAQQFYYEETEQGKEWAPVHYQIVNNQLRVQWDEEELGEKHKAKIQKLIGHEDIPYFIWENGVAECLNRDSTRHSIEQDCRGSTEELVSWYWRLADYIVKTKMTTTVTSHATRAAQRYEDTLSLRTRLLS